MQKDLLEQLDLLLSDEEVVVDALRKTETAKQLSRTRHRLLAIIREATRNADLPLIVAVEKAIVERQLNALGMSASE